MLVVTWVAAVALLKLASAEYAANTFFNWTFAVHDPVVGLYPDEMRDIDSTTVPFDPLWKMSFTGTEGPYEKGQLGLGDSYATSSFTPTNPDGRQIPQVQAVALPYTMLYLKGEANGNVIGIVNFEAGDTRSLANSNGWIMSMPAPAGTYKSYSVGMGLTSGSWRVDQMVVTMATQTSVSSWDKVSTMVQRFATRPSTAAGTLSANSFFDFTGQWLIADTIRGVGGQKEKTFEHLIGDFGASVTITTPPHTALVVVNGAVHPDGASLMFDWNPNPPTGETAPIINTQAPYVAPATFTVQPLDPAINYTLKITHADQTTIRLNKTVWLESVKFYSALDPDAIGNSTDPANANPTKKSTNVAAIAGGVGGGIGGLLLLALLGFCCWKKRRPKKWQADNARFEVDTVGPEVDPYLSPKVVAAHDPNGTFAGSSVPAVGYADGAVRSPESATPSSQPSKSDSTPRTMDEVSTSSGSRSPLWPEGLAPYKQPYILPLVSSHGNPPPNVRTFTQEEDAGAIPIVVQEEERIPPRYDPAWRSPTELAAGDTSPALSTGSRPLPRPPQ